MGSGDVSDDLSSPEPRPFSPSAYTNVFVRDVHLSTWHTICQITLSKHWYMVTHVVKLFAGIWKVSISKIGGEAD